LKDLLRDSVRAVVYNIPAFALPGTVTLACGRRALLQPVFIVAERGFAAGTLLLTATPALLTSGALRRADCATPLAVVRDITFSRSSRDIWTRRRALRDAGERWHSCRQRAAAIRSAGRCWTGRNAFPYILGLLFSAGELICHRTVANAFAIRASTR